MNLKLTVLLAGLTAGVFTLPPAKAGEPARALSAPIQAGVAGAGGSFAPSFSGDGRHLVFVSYAKNLVTNDDLAPFLDVFVHDLAAGTTRLISVNTNGIGGGNDNATSPSISSNGQFVAFATAANNLVPGDTNNASDIFVRDLGSNVTELISVDVSGVGPANAFPANYAVVNLCGNPRISADGRWVVFESKATNLTALSDHNRDIDIFARDRHSGTTVLVSVNTNGTTAANRPSRLCDVTPDGRFVVFFSTATDLVTNTISQAGEIYVRDLNAGITYWASTNVGTYYPPGPNAYRCSNPVISVDGRWVAFSAACQFPSPSLFVHDLQTGLSTRVSTDAQTNSWPVISTDGRFLAYDSGTNVYVWDRLSSTNELINVNAAGTRPGNAPARTLAMSPDGRAVVFASKATDLVDNAANGLCQLYVRDVWMATTRLVSENLNAVASSRDFGWASAALSPDGELVAFDTEAEDLVPDDSNAESDIFIRDVSVHSTVLISQHSPDLTARTRPVISLAEPQCISADGQHVVFTSPEGPYPLTDVYCRRGIFVGDESDNTVRNIGSGLGSLQNTNEFIQPAISRDGRFVAFLATGLASSRRPGYPVSGNILRYDLQTGNWRYANVGDNYFLDGPGTSPAISGNGRLVAYQSQDGNYPYTRVYLHDMVTWTNQVLSINRDGSTAFSLYSTNAIFSPDDRWVLFQSQASDLATNLNLNNSSLHLYARDLWSNTTSLVSIAPDGNVNWNCTHSAVFAADSRHLAYVATAEDSSTYTIFRHDLETHTSTIVCDNCGSPSLSSNAQLIAYASSPGVDGEPAEIFLQDLQAGITQLISISLTGAAGNGDSTSPLLSPNERFVVFASKASDLVPNDTNNASDIFVCDRLLGTTLLASVNRWDTESGNGPSSKPIMAADGRTVVFRSFASDLVAGDYNDQADVFVLRLGGFDSDGDGMDDDWEMAFFGTLARDGTGDYDGDGMTDLQEILAGTDPTNGGSILRVFTLTLPSSSSTTVLWSAVAGRSYRVQFIDQIGGSAWADLPGTVTATSTTGAKVDTTASSQRQRFYRVLLAN